MISPTRPELVTVDVNTFVYVYSWSILLNSRRVVMSALPTPQQFPWLRSVTSSTTNRVGGGPA